MNNNKKLTAVQMAFEKLAQQGLLVIDDYENLNVYHEAKAMEKEQIKNAYQSDRFPCSEEDSEQYYNETYKQP
jgi:hypothetical protein